MEGFRLKGKGIGPSFRYAADGTVWESIDLGDWIAYVRFEAEEGHPVIAELRVFPRATSDAQQAWVDEWFKLPENLDPERVTREGGWPEPPETPVGGLTARGLRKLNLGESISAAYKDMALDPSLVRDWTGFSKRALSEPRRPGRKGRAPSFYAEIARAYVEKIKQGSKTPVKDVADEIGYSQAHVRDLLSQARARALLTRPPKGRAGGELTEKGRKALEDGSEA